MCRKVSKRDDDQRNAPAAAVGLAGAMISASFQKPGQEPRGPQHQPGAGHDAAERRGLAHADESIPQPPGARDGAADMQQVAEAEKIQHRDHRARGERGDHRAKPKEPVERGRALLRNNPGFGARARCACAGTAEVPMSGTVDRMGCDG